MKKKTWNAPDRYLTRKQTMEKLGISSSTLYRIYNSEKHFSGIGESIRFRGKRLYLKDAVEKYFEEVIKINHEKRI